MQIIGRKEELFELQKAWAVALSGRPRVVFVEGPDGVGKTHLVRAFFDKISGQKTIEKPQLLGYGLCADSGAWSEPLRPAWEALAGLARGLKTADDGSAIDELEAIGRLSGFVPDEYLGTLGPVMAKILREHGADDLRSSERLLSAPKALIRDSVLGLAAQHPVALFFDELEAADGQTLGFLAHLLDALLEHEEPSHFLLVLGFDPRLAASRGVLGGVKERLRRHDHPKNRILKQLRLKGLHPAMAASTGSADDDADRSASQAFGETIAALDVEDQRLLAAASLQGRRFSPATLASVCSRSELDIIRALDRLSRQGIVRPVGRAAPFDPGGCGMYAFDSRLYLEASRARIGAEERRLVHGRIANHLLLQRGQLRECRRHLKSAREDGDRGSIDRRFARQMAHLERAMRALNRILVDHMAGSGRHLEAARFLSAAFAEHNAHTPSDRFARLATARSALWFARRAEKTLLALMGVQPAADPERTTRAVCQAALVAASCRARMGCFRSARSLLATAAEAAAWLDDTELEAKAAKIELRGDIEPLDLLAASLSEYGDDAEGPSVRELLDKARAARKDDRLDEAIDHLEDARDQIPPRPECRPAGRLVEEEMSLLWEMRASRAEAKDQANEACMSSLERAIEHSLRLGQLGSAVESLGRAVGLARRCRSPKFWRLHAQLFDTAGQTRQVEHLNRSFDIGFELLEQAQRQPVFDETEPLRLQDALERFVGDNTAHLREAGADGLLSKWDKMLSRVIEETEQMVRPDE